MDKERKKRLRTIKLIVTEVIMVVAIAVMVVILTMLAMGYNLNKDGELGQSGLVQIKSIPTGAEVIIDGEMIAPHTNTSRMLSAGKHQIKLQKEGYDSWNKEIESESGWLLKLDYARLFLQNRTAEKVREYDGDFKFIVPASDGSQIIYATDNSTKWKLLNIRSDDVSEMELDVAEITAGLEIKNVFWNENNDKLLVMTKKGEATEWLLINTKDINNSINLSRQFGMDFSDVKFLTADGQRLLGLEQGNLRLITVSNKTVSQVMAKNVDNYYTDSGNIIYSKKADDKYMMMLYQEATEDVLVTEFPKDSRVKLALSQYLGKKYLMFTVNNRMYVYRGELPTAERTLSEMELVIESDIDFIPDNLTVWTDDQLVMARKAEKIAMFDAELGKLYNYEVESDKVFFLDMYLIGTIVDNKLIVRDFDGGNRRELANATGASVITINHKWLYYCTKINDKVNIFREKIVD
ncbi:PEGA domain-containing protein [Candidatus Saccharibacteria bacterium]|nr:PEGA domain-containing protein [Candidatus Saccharibacteria bacterium]